MKKKLLLVLLALLPIATLTTFTSCGDDDEDQGNIPTTIMVKRITLSASNMELKKGETKTLTITVSPSDAANKKVVWTSNNPTVAFPDQKGMITAVNVGNCVITCQAVDGSGVKAECKVTVKENPDSGGNDPGTQDDTDIHVIVNEDGTTSNGSIFSAIDDKNFYIDYIKYTVTEGHLIVSGYDKAGFKGVAKIISKLTYKGNTYEVLGIGNAFRGSSILTSIIIPNSVISIGSKPFDECGSLTSVTIGSGVTYIGELAFGDCTSLTSVTIGSGVTSIGGYAFFNCSSLKNVYCYPENVPYTVSDAFYGTPISSATLHVPAVSVNAYKAADYWKDFKSIVAL